MKCEFLIRQSKNNNKDHIYTGKLAQQNEFAAMNQGPVNAYSSPEIQQSGSVKSSLLQQKSRIGNFCHL